MKLNSFLFSGKQQLASDVDTDEKSQAPGIGMKLTVAGICQKFSTVKHISTGRLSNWMKQAEGQTEGQSNTGTGNLVILVILKRDSALILAPQIICCVHVCLSEFLGKGDSNGYPQHMILWRNIGNVFQNYNLIIKVNSNTRFPLFS